MSTSAALSAAEVLALPAMPQLYPDAAAALNLSKNLAYQLHREGSFPIPVVTFHRTLRVRRSDLLAFLGIEDTGDHSS